MLWYDKASQNIVSLNNINLLFPRFFNLDCTWLFMMTAEIRISKTAPPLTCLVLYMEEQKQLEVIQVFPLSP